MIEINLVSVMVLAQLAGRAMLAQGGGSIVNVASILGLVAPGDTAMAGYTAAKAGVIGVTRDLAAEWGRRGVRVNALCPGYFPTDDDRGASTHPGAIKRIERRTLLGRVPRLDELDGAPALPGLGRLQLHDRADARDRRRLDCLVDSTTYQRHSQ